MTLKQKFLAAGSALLAAIALSATISVAQAQPYRDRDSYRHGCRAQIERAETRLERAIRRHGRHSYQARERRRDLRHVRDRCDRRYRRDRHRPY